MAEKTTIYHLDEGQSHSFKNVSYHWRIVFACRNKALKNQKVTYLTYNFYRYVSKLQTKKIVTYKKFAEFILNMPIVYKNTN